MFGTKPERIKVVLTKLEQKEHLNMGMLCLNHCQENRHFLQRVNTGASLKHEQLL